MTITNEEKDSASVNLLSNSGFRSGSVKITITPCQPKTLTHLPKRPPVDIAFSDLTYTVSEGRKKREYLLKHLLFFGVSRSAQIMVVSSQEQWWIQEGREYPSMRKI